MQNISFLDILIKEFDSALRTLAPPSKRVPLRRSSAAEIKEHSLSSSAKKHIAGLMRVNHAGEVCAQALYQGQALTAQLTHVKQKMAQAAAEEIDHLAWCEERLAELGSKPSLLNPIWYSGSFLLGALAGWAGDRISLGFVAETEKQVVAHLQKHLQEIPPEDKKTKAIIEQMQADEEEHATQAMNAGGAELPYIIKYLMGIISKLMTRSSYHI